jgi:hypothetical protein
MTVGGACPEHGAGVLNSREFTVGMLYSEAVKYTTLSILPLCPEKKPEIWITNGSNFTR